MSAGAAKDKEASGTDVEVHIGSRSTTPPPISNAPTAVASVDEKTQEPEQHAFEDGGRKAWLTAAGSWMISCSTLGMVSSFGAFEDYYVSAHGHAASDVAWIGSIQLCLLYVMGIFAGKAFDDGHLRHLIFIGSVIYIFGLFMLSLADPGKYYQIFLAQGVCCGIGFGIVFVPSVGAVAHHFTRLRALAIGIVVTGSSFGGVIFTIALNYMFRPQSLGFANGVRVVAGICAALTICANILLRADVPPRGTGQREPLYKSLRLLRDRDYVLGILAMSCMSFAIFFPVFYIQVDSRVHGVSETLSFYTISILNGVGAVGRILPSFAADKLGILNMMALTLIACGACTLGMFGLTSNPSTRVAAVVLISVFYGFFSGGALGLAGAIGPALSRGMHEVGMRTGILFFIMGICCLLGSPVSGWLLGTDPTNYHWWRGIVFAAIMHFAGAAFMVATASDVSRRKGSRRV